MAVPASQFIALQAINALKGTISGLRLATSWNVLTKPNIRQEDLSLYRFGLNEGV